MTGMLETWIQDVRSFPKNTNELQNSSLNDKSTTSNKYVVTTAKVRGNIKAVF